MSHVEKRTKPMPSLTIIRLFFFELMALKTVEVGLPLKIYSKTLLPGSNENES